MRITYFAGNVNFATRYGGLVPLLYFRIRLFLKAIRHNVSVYDLCGIRRKSDSAANQMFV